MDDLNKPLDTIPAGAVEVAGVAPAAEFARLTQRIADLERKAENLQRALDSARVIGAAVGIIMERDRVTADEAFEVLSNVSQRANVKLRDVAATVMLTGEY